MSFTNYYYNYGFNSTMEKIAADKKNEGMPTGAKAALGLGGAAGLAGLGYGAHQGYLGAGAQELLGQGMAAGKDAIDYTGDKGAEVAEYIKNLLAQAGHGARDLGHGTMQGMKELGQDAGQLYHKAKDGLGLNTMGDNIQNLGTRAGNAAGNSLDAIKEAIIRNNPMR